MKCLQLLRIQYCFILKYIQNILIKENRKTNKL